MLIRKIRGCNNYEILCKKIRDNYCRGLARIKLRELSWAVYGNHRLQDAETSWRPHFPPRGLTPLARRRPGFFSFLRERHNHGRGNNYPYN